MSTYDVKIWDPKKIGDTAKGRWRVRWAAAGREHCRSFAAKPLADGFITGLKDAIRDHQPFDEITGLPARPGHAARPRSWYEHARAYAEMKWPGQAATSRRSSAEALTTVTVALAPRRRGAPGPEVLRRALFGWAFNPGTRELDPPADTAAALSWVAAASQPLAALEDPATLRTVLGACARTCAGKPAAATTQRRKRAVFYNALGYAVEQGLLGANPVDRIQWKAPEVAETVDRRVVASPAQAQALLAAVRAQGPRGAHLEAFFGCLYYAAMRPSEAVSLRETDCHLPARGWGRIDLAASEPRAGRGWTDDGAAREARGLKHRAEHEMRSVPIPPELVALLRAHLQRYGTGPDGRLFRTARDGAIQESAYGAIWQAARTAAFTAAQQSSPLARRAYDLRHAAVSLWLNAGVPATEVARRAGHSVAVLLKVYAHCIDGQAGAANQRITDALTTPDDESTPDDQQS
ncbi:MAG TPA: tyrosine-type recombinase/integrase [Streptosporangiaceae bacterium]